MILKESNTKNGCKKRNNFFKYNKNILKIKLEHTENQKKLSQQNSARPKKLVVNSPKKMQNSLSK